MSKMINLNINNIPVSVPEGLTIIEAAKRNGVSIPTLCYVEDLHEYGSCRICVVEVEGAKTLQASCVTKARDGMVIKTNSEKVRKARKVLYELIISDHSKDCLSCTRNQSCELQELGKTLGVDSSRFEGERSMWHTDASVSITRDMSKCILCRRCVTVCGGVQETAILSAQNRGFDTEIAPPLCQPIGAVNCAFCGQCTVICPVGALKETPSVQAVWDAIANPDLRTVVQVAPAVRVALGEEFGMETGSRVTGKMASALRRIGFDDIFDTNFAADLTILEEGTEFLGRLSDALHDKKVTLPMITSCSPGWIKYVENHFPDQLDHLSSCKSPHTMLGALIKSYYAKKINKKPEEMFVVSVMPCTAKKFEIVRSEMQNDGCRNVDAVLTTRELAEMIRHAGIDFVNLGDETFDNPLGMSTGAADIFGLTGGVMEAALRTVYELVTGRELPFEGLHVTPIVGLDQIKEAAITIEDPLPEYQFLDGVTARLAVTSGLAGAKKLLEQIRDGNSPYHFIEIMGCPSGCIMGGGQPRSSDPDVRAKRLNAIYTEDESKDLRKSHENPFVKSLYDEFLGKPNGHLSHELLHTEYVKRGKYNQFYDETYEVDMKPAKAPKNSAGAGKGGGGGSNGSAAGGASGAAAKSGGPKREELESLSVLKLEAENRRLKSELEDVKETVDILKSVISDQRQ